MTEQSKPVLWRRVVRRIGILLGTTATLGIAGLAVVGGTRLIANTPDPSSAISAPAPFVADTAPLVLQDSHIALSRYTGRLEPRRSTTLGFELPGTLQDLAVEEGDRVATGTLLARLDTRTLEARRAEQVAAKAALVAQTDLARATLKRQEALSERSFASQQRFDEARFALVRLEAELDRLEAGILSTDIQIAKSEIRAPYAGRIGVTYLDDGAATGAGAPVLELLEDAAPRLRVGLPADVLPTLEIEALRITLNGTDYPVEAIRRRGDIDPITRTQTVLFDLPAGADALPAGSLGTLALAREVPSQGAWVEAAALSEGLRGLWTLYIVDAEGTAQRESVELIHAEGDRVFVNGTFPAGSSYVTSGTHRIAPGQIIVASGN